MNTRTETTFTLADAEPYIRIEASRYTVAFSTVERLSDGNAQEVKIVLPKACREQLLRACLQEIRNLRHTGSEPEDKEFALRFLDETASDVADALRTLRPETVEA